MTEEKFEAHTKAVGEFLNEMYATMVDPVDNFQGTVAELCAKLLEVAREHLEQTTNVAGNAHGKGQESGYSDGYGDCLAGNKPLYTPTLASRLPINPLALQEDRLSEAKAEHGKTLLLLHTAAFETIPNLEAKFETVLAELHSATHGNIFSPEGLNVHNCPQCAELRK